MGSQPDSLPAVDAILSGPYWPGRVRLDVVTLDEQSRLISRNFNRQELQRLVVETEPGELALDGDPAGFKLAAEATRMRLAYTYDPQFAVSVARIDPLPHQLEAVYHYMLKQPRLRFLLADEDECIRWLAGGTLVKFGGKDVVRYLAAFLEQGPNAEAREQVKWVLGAIADAAEDEEVGRWWNDFPAGDL